MDDLGSPDDSLEEWNRPLPGRGTALAPFEGGVGMTRTRFVHREGAALLTLDVDRTKERAALYLDGWQVARGEMPVRFGLEEGVLEVSCSLWGMKRVHLVWHDGGEQRLTPAEGSPEQRRAAFGRRHPGLSRAVAAAAVVVLAVDLVLLAPQLLEIVSALEIWPLGQFRSPISLPGPLNVVLTAAGALAATERALTFRHHKVLDAETEWIDS